MDKLFSVEELIACLQKLPSDAIVVFRDSHNNGIPAKFNKVTLKKVGTPGYPDYDTFVELSYDDCIVSCSQILE